MSYIRNIECAISSEPSVTISEKSDYDLNLPSFRVEGFDKSCAGVICFRYYDKFVK